ncbi:MAG: hypothetical protein KGO49_06485 [Gammaproteobacteria bacterium]|nr:hypothetical protein [Gammaproteobacteria bacterium]
MPFNKTCSDNSLFTSERFIKLLSLIAFATLLFSAKLWLICSYGNPTPFWDQWDAEAAKLYAPFLEGTLHLQDLFSAHNEHRIFTTRLLSLAELKVNGVWSPILQMVVNAVLHIIVLILIIILMLKVVGQKYLFPILIFSLILFSMPYAFENTLEGFQAQFYFVLFFSIVALWLMVTKPPFSVLWWVGLASSGVAYFSFASGIFSIAASVGVSLILYCVSDLRHSKKQILAIFVLIVAFVLGVLFTPVSPKMHPPLPIIHALFAILSWPFNKYSILFLLVNAPAIIFLSNMYRHRPHASDPRWFIVGLLIWAAIQSISIAYGRYEAPLSSRYMDLYAILILINFICLLLVLNPPRLRDSRFNFKMLGGVFWVLVILIPLVEGSHTSLRYAKGLYQKGLEQQINTQNYVATGNINFLKNKPDLSIPYPNPDRLAMLLSKPSIRSILPSNIASPELKKDGNLDAFITNLLMNYKIFLYAGLMFLILAMTCSAFRCKRKFP